MSNYRCQVCDVNLFKQPHKEWCATGTPPQDKPENTSPHTVTSDHVSERDRLLANNQTVTSDYLPPRDFGVREHPMGIPRMATITPGPVDGDGRAAHAVHDCTCRYDTHAICPLHPLRITEEIDYSNFEVKGEAFARFVENFAKSRTTLPTDPTARKNMPITSGVLDYFPAAIAEVAKVSFIGNEKHNPGQDLHHARGKSMDHADCIARHLIERGTIDTVKLADGREFEVRHSAYVAWRALALLQEELEKAGAPMARGAR